MNKLSDLATLDEKPALFTAEEFVEIAISGVFENWAGKVELVEGVIVRMNAALNLHFHYQRQLFLKLNAIFGEGREGYIVGQEPTVRLGARTVRDPDVAILRDVGPIRDINKAEDVLLVAEVSDSSLRQDRGSKLRSYAKAGIAHYWIVDVKGRKVELHNEPEGEAYSKNAKAVFGERISVPGTGESITIE